MRRKVRVNQPITNKSIFAVAAPCHINILQITKIMTIHQGINFLLEAIETLQL